MKRVILVFSLLFCSAAGTYSQATVRYNATVNYGIGAHAADFPAGEPVTVTYTLSTSTTDANADPRRGDYDNAVLSMSVSFPGLGIFVNTGPQTSPFQAAVFTYDNIPSGPNLADLVYFHGGPITFSSPLGGDAISWVQLEYSTIPPALPTMLPGDALPRYRLSPTHSYIHLQTSSGLATVKITIPPPVTLSYDAVVRNALGPNAGAFPVGQLMRLTYTLDPDMIDTNADPERGFYQRTVLAMSINFPGLGIYSNAGPPTGPLFGNALVINDSTLSTGQIGDQVFFSGASATSSLLGGELISSIGADFRESVMPPAIPAMISSDDLPITSLGTPGHVVLSTPSVGATSVLLSPSPPDVTRSYEAVVTFADGPHAALFPVGESITVNYTLEPLAHDSNADPDRGAFSNAVVSMNISFPGLGINAQSEGGGLAQTFNNVASSSGQVSDQVFFHGGPILSASSLGGEALSQIEVDFLSLFVSPPTQPTMLTSDALPLTQLPMTDSFVVLRTATGPTFVSFAPPPLERIEMLIRDLETLEAAYELTRHQANVLTNKLEAAITSLDGGHPGPARNHLGSFIDKVKQFVDRDEISRPQGRALIVPAKKNPQADRRC